MSLFREKKSSYTPSINTASLPDIIFMLLFFFMVTTTLKETNLMVRIRQPRADESEKLEKKSLITYIYIGKPNDESLGSKMRIQINDAFVDIEDIAGYIESERALLPESEQSQMLVSLKIDKEAKMGVITDVKQELRKINALKISYSAHK